MPIEINGVLISDREINVESAHHDGGIVERQNRAAVALTVRNLLLQRAAELGMAPADESGADDLIDALLTREVRTPDPDDAACRRYYDANRELFRGADHADVRHILLAAAPDDAHARDRARELAEALIAELGDEPTRFPELARAHSACPSREQGGSLGRIGRGQTVPEFESRVLRLPIGLCARPLETRYGYHVVRVEARETGRPLDYDEVRERIAGYLTDQGWRQAVRQYLQWLAGRSRIKGIDLSAEPRP